MDHAYITLRARLGLSEGVIDHPPEKALPLQCNVDLLNGGVCWSGDEEARPGSHTGIAWLATRCNN